MSKPKTLTRAAVPMPAAIDPEAIRTLVTRRIALRLGLTMHVAATIAALAGVGPDGRTA